jgi:hypothetical protein
MSLKFEIKYFVPSPAEIGRQGDSAGEAQLQITDPFSHQRGRPIITNL